ncbi:type VI secretion system Vgr family protein [Chondromyces apiculatus]|nr:type VI secretion system tip protein TssI/VgrG [Chondromyces apiculatus]
MAREAVRVRLESEQFSCDEVEIHTLSGREAISRPFRFDLGIVCLNPDALTAADMEGAEATLVFESEGEELRRVHGMIAEIDDLLSTEVETRSFQVVFVPRVHRMTLVETQEIYMDLNLPGILRQKLELVGLGSEDVEMRLAAEYPPLEFVVQYKETDLTFISRLTEHCGVSFFFEHVDGRDKIVFTDHRGGFHPASPEKAQFRRRGEDRGVFHVEAKTRLVPKSYILQDYNYRTPQTDLTSSAETPSGLAGGVVEQGAHFKTPDEGKALAQIRAEELEATHVVYRGQSELCHFAAGGRITLEEHPRIGDGVAPLLLVEVEHHVTQAVAIHGGKEGKPYTNSFRAIDAGLTYRPPRVTPRPRIHGVTTGIIEQNLGSTQEEFAEIDQQGRYLVRFLFDTAPPGQRKASRPVRMAQPHAGPNYGMHFPLKPGIEVLLIFIDGDPDRPLIVGSVPNPVTQSPVVDRNALLNRIKTASGIIFEMKDC